MDDNASVVATMRVRDISGALDRPHYLVAAYDSTEQFNQRVVVVVDSLTEPAWVLRPDARSAGRRGSLALAVPSLDALTLHVAQQLTRVVTDYIVVREWATADRAAGRWQAGAVVKTFSGHRA